LWRKAAPPPGKDFDSSEYYVRNCYKYNRDKKETVIVCEIFNSPRMLNIKFEPDPLELEPHCVTAPAAPIVQLSQYVMYYTIYCRAGAVSWGVGPMGARDVDISHVKNEL
jgi:hypothetical protein